MNDEHEARILVDRGNRAAELLKNDMIVEAFQVMEARLWDQFKQVPARDAEGREYIHKMVAVLTNFQSHFHAVVLEGENAAARIRTKDSVFFDYPGAKEAARTR